MISDENFPKEEHLLKTKDFRKVYNNGRFSKRDALVLYRLPNTLEHNRIGFSISSRNIKLATRRNRIRRILREVYRKNKNILKSGSDIVLVVKKDLGLMATYGRLRELFLRAAKDTGILL